MDRRSALAGLAALSFAPRLAFGQSISTASLVAQVDAATLREHVFGLSSFPTRWTNHPEFGAVEQWVVDAFAAVTVPSFVKAGRKFGTFSNFTRLYSSSSETMVVPRLLFTSTGTISAAKLPFSVASATFL